MKCVRASAFHLIWWSPPTSRTKLVRCVERRRAPHSRTCHIYRARSAAHAALHALELRSDVMLGSCACNEAAELDLVAHVFNHRVDGVAVFHL